MPTQAESRPVQRLVILLLATFVALNPIVLYLLSRSLMITGAITLASLVSMWLVVRCQHPRLFGVVLFNMLTIVSCLLHAEMLLRVAFPWAVPSQLYVVRDGYYANRPYLAERFTAEEYSAEYHTNRQGLRIAPGQNPDAAISAADWLFVGDSFTQGAQVDFADLFSTQVYTRFPDRVVVNAGISGLGLGQELNFFLAEGRRLSPRLVVLQVGAFNDFMKVRAPRAGLSEHLIAHSFVARVLLSRAWTDGASLPLGRWTEPFQPSYDANVDYNIFFTAESSVKDRDIADLEVHLERFRAAVESVGGELLVVLFPTREQTYAESLAEVLAAYHIPGSAVDMHQPNRILADICERLHIDFVDLLPAFQGGGTGLFFDSDEHLSARGHAVVANVLSDHLRLRFGPSSATLVSESLEPQRYPTLSRDGTSAAFQAVRNGQSDLVIANARFREPRWITASGADESHPSLSPDGTQVAFTTGEAASLQTNVVLMGIDGSRRRLLTPQATAFGAIPTFSRTGRQIAFAQWHLDPSTNTFSQPRIALLDTASGTTTPLTSPERESWRPVMSPTETSVAYISRMDDQFDLFLYDLTTGLERRLTSTPFDEWDPRFTPDGRSLVYAARAAGNWDLFTLDLHTMRSDQLTKTLGDEWDPFVTNDGLTLLYAGRFGSFESIYRRSLH